MHRLLSISAALLSFCALLTSFLLWREVRTLRLEAAQRLTRVRLSDEQFTLAKDFVAWVHTTFDEGHVPRSMVLTADQLLNKARYMHGDITHAEWHRLNSEAAPERMRLDVARIQAGAGTIDNIQLLYDDLLESSR